MIVVVVGSGLDSFHSTEFGLVVVCRNLRGFAHFRRGGGECLVWFLLASCLLFAAPDPLNPVLGRREIAFNGVDGGADSGAAKTITYATLIICFFTKLPPIFTLNFYRKYGRIYLVPISF